MPQPSPLVSEIHHASLIVADTSRSLAFYRDILGLSPLAERPDLGFPGAWLAVGRGQIHLLELPNPDPSQGRPAHGGRDRHLALTAPDLAPCRRMIDCRPLGAALAPSDAWPATASGGRVGSGTPCAAAACRGRVAPLARWNSERLARRPPRSSAQGLPAARRSRRRQGRQASQVMRPRCPSPWIPSLLAP